MTEPSKPRDALDAVTTPAGVTTICPQCGVSLDALTTACARCGAVITGGGSDGERAERLRQRLQGQVGPSYQMGPVIGRGGMGIVFRAREVSLDREVALKVLAFDALLNPEAFTRFEREARLAARLDHPNIVPIFAVGQGDGAAFYTMRYVRGGSLESLIADQGALPLDDAVRLLREVASALDFAHGQGIVHRDVKPANILLSDGAHAMVADFGIARAFTDEGGTSTSGSQTGVVGSPAYMAPEQWRGDKPGGAADQYALAVLAFELISGQRPFRDVSMQELLRMHLAEDPPAIETVRAGLPPCVGQAIRRAMAKNPADRFPTVSAFVAALAGEAAVGELQSRKTVVRQGGAAAALLARATPARATPGAPETHRGRQWIGNALALVMVLTAAAVGLNEWRRSRAAPQAAAPQATAPAAQSAAPADTLAERLAGELEETRKIALDAQRRAERAEALQREEARVKSAAPAPLGHVMVQVRGGAPRLLIDGKESAASTPAIISVPTGRHIVRVEEAGRRYQPQQYVIDVGVGDTSRLVFADPRVGNRDVARFEQQLQQMTGGQAQRTGWPRRADSAGAAYRSSGGTPPATNAWTPSAGPMNPFALPPRIWQNLSAQEQGMLRTRWSRMSPAQQRNAVMQGAQMRDSMAGRYPQRMPQSVLQPMPQRVPQPVPPASQKPAEP